MYTVHFFLTVAIGNCMAKLITMYSVNFYSDVCIQIISGTKLEDFLNYWKITIQYLKLAKKL
jgi:hypothetical protein